MVRLKGIYTIEVHLPDNEEGLCNLRKKMGCAYHLFIKNYILSLHISDMEKNRLYSMVIEKLSSKKAVGHDEI